MLKLGYDSQVSFSEASARRPLNLQGETTEAGGSGSIYVVFIPLSLCLTHPHPLSLPLTLHLLVGGQQFRPSHRG